MKGPIVPPIPPVRCPACGTYTQQIIISGRIRQCARCQEQFRKKRGPGRPPKITQRGIWAKLTDPAKRKQHASKMGQQRWAALTPEELSARMREMAQAPRPSRYIKHRCPCGRYSAWLAVKRGHRCVG